MSAAQVVSGADESEAPEVTIAASQGQTEESLKHERIVQWQ